MQGRSSRTVYSTANYWNMNRHGKVTTRLLAAARAFNSTRDS